MKHISYILFLLLALNAEAQGIWTIPKPVIVASNPYTHAGSFTIAALGAANITTLTVFDTLKDADFKTVANGGSVQNTISYNGQIVPADLVFSTSPIFATLMNYEVFYYNASTGMMVVYFDIPNYSYSVNTTIYVGVGSASLSTYQGGAVGNSFNANTVLAIPFPNGTTLSALDYSNESNNGTIASATAYSGFAGGVADFSGSNEYVYFPNSSSLQYTGASTLSGWFYITSYPGAQILLGQWNDNPYGNCLLTIGDALYALIGAPGGGTSTFGVLGYSYSTVNTWVYLSAQFNPGVGVYLDINGVQVANNTSSVPSSQNAGGPNNVMAIGASYPENTYYFNGMAKDCRVRKEVVTDNQLYVETQIEMPGSIATSGIIWAY